MSQDVAPWVHRLMVDNEALKARVEKLKAALNGCVQVLNLALACDGNNPGPTNHAKSFNGVCDDCNWPADARDAIAAALESKS